MMNSDGCWITDSFLFLPLPPLHIADTKAEQLKAKKQIQREATKRINVLRRAGLLPTDGTEVAVVQAEIYLTATCPPSNYTS